MILCVGTTPALQRVMVFRKVTRDAVNRASTTLDGPSGKSINVAKVLQTLGEPTVAITLLGGHRGDFIAERLRARALSVESIPAGCASRECITVIDESTQTQTELVEESQCVGPTCLDALLEKVRLALPGCRAMVLSGTVAPGLPDDLYLRLLEAARPAKGLVVIDTQGKPLLESLAGRPSVVKPNRQELAAATGRELVDTASVIHAMRELYTRGAERIVVTAGQHPTLAFDGQNTWAITPPCIKTVNPIGSGDAFTAAMVSRLVRGDNLGEACRWGSAAGAANALTLMPGELELGEVKRLAGEVQVELLPP